MGQTIQALADSWQKGKDNSRAAEVIRALPLFYRLKLSAKIADKLSFVCSSSLDQKALLKAAAKNGIAIDATFLTARWIDLKEWGKPLYHGKYVIKRSSNGVVVYNQNILEAAEKCRLKMEQMPEPKGSKLARLRQDSEKAEQDVKRALEGDTLEKAAAQKDLEAESGDSEQTPPESNLPADAKKKPGESEAI